MNRPTAEAGELLAEMVGMIVSQLPDGLTATVVLAAGDEDRFEVAVAGTTPPALLVLVLQRALERVQDRLAAEAGRVN
jgi:hypothetical protein